MQKFTLQIPIFLIVLLSTFQLHADPFFNDDSSVCRGKVELAPAYVHVDFLKSGKTLNSMNLICVKGDLNYRVWSGFVLKPSFLYGKGKHDHKIATGGVGLGFCIPLTCYKVVITPVAGINFGYLRTSFDFKHELAPGGKIHVKERFRSRSPYAGFELSWTFIPSWRVVFSYQYAWSRTHTKIDPLGNERSKSKGSNYAGMIEYDINDCWSVNFGAAYNNSLSKEKHGIRAWGLKLGIAYWF